MKSKREREEMDLAEIECVLFTGELEVAANEEKRGQKAGNRRRQSL